MCARIGINASEAAMFKDIAAVMGRYPGAVEQFGLTRVHSHFPLKPGEVLLERTDADARVSVVTPVDMAALTDKAKPTAYVLDAEGEPSVAQWCCD